MTSERKKTPENTIATVLFESARRCCLCFHLYGDLGLKHGQIAHLDQNAGNASLENLAFMCLNHHSEYDSKTSQHKNFTIIEVKSARNGLHKAIKNNNHHASSHASKEIIEEAKHLYPQTEELLKETFESKSSIVNLLRKARQIAIQVKDTDFEKWLEQELSGYSVNVKELPYYRQVYGQLKSFNPLRDWESVRFEKGEHQKIFSFAPIGQSIGSLEKSLSEDRKNGYFIFQHQPEQKHQILSMIPDSHDVQLRLPFEVIDRIVDSVRNQLYEWLLKLQR